jgi:hypothetical protein
MTLMTVVIISGGAVDIYNDLMVVGADGDNHNEVRTGTVYVYKRYNRKGAPSYNRGVVDIVLFVIVD